MDHCLPLFTAPRYGFSLAGASRDPQEHHDAVGRYDAAIVRRLRAVADPQATRPAREKADPVDHEDFDDSYALNDIRTNELRLPTMADLMSRTDEELRERQKDTSKREALRQKAGESIVDGSRAVLGTARGPRVAQPHPF